MKNYSIPAFPIGGSGGYNISPGMTLRDYFAAKAMQGILSRTPNGFGNCTGFDGLANAAYSVADAMLADREK